MVRLSGGSCFWPYPLLLFDLSFWGCVSFRVWFDGFTRFLSDVLASWATDWEAGTCYRAFIRLAGDSISDGRTGSTQGLIWWARCRGSMIQRFCLTTFVCFGCRYLFGMASWLDCSRDPVVLNSCRSRLIAFPVSSVINSFCCLLCVLGVQAFFTWIICELSNNDFDNRGTCLKLTTR